MKEYFLFQRNTTAEISFLVKKQKECIINTNNTKGCFYLFTLFAEPKQEN